MVSSVQKYDSSEVILSQTEKVALADSPFEVIYRPTEKIPTIVVDNFPALGKLTAMRFVEWAQQNPGGVISLPTGKTPEYFIKWVIHLLDGWDKPEIKAELEAAGIDPSIKPDMNSLHFVQIDEFYPMNPRQQNSFNHYVQKFYTDQFGLDPDKALLIDCSTIGLEPKEDISDIWPDNKVDLTLRHRQPKNHLESKQQRVLYRIDQWCMDYEQKIQNLGGIGFFLGGIGPDGHIGFNISGSDHHCTTRLCPINYETQAAAATDLGGIEVARKCLVITIGLRTITRNPDCVAIIMAAGQAKAALVAGAIQSVPDVNKPATALQSLKNARFYITSGAAKQLAQRQLHLLETTQTYSDQLAEQILIDLAYAKGKRLIDLTDADCSEDSSSQLLLQRRSQSLNELTLMVQNRLIDKIERGIEVHDNKRFLHTEPHHDDIMLGYFAHVVRHFRRAGNSHHFMTLTSGFTSVTNHFIDTQLTDLQRFLQTHEFAKLYEQDYFNPGNITNRNRDIWQYLDGVASRDENHKAQGCCRRLLRNLIEVYADSTLDNITTRIKELKAYFASSYPGKRDEQHIQQLKGMAREWEAECLWGYYGWKCDNVMHTRLGFYTGDIFTQDPTLTGDVPPIVDALKKVNPDIISVALDPEASGPDTHYKVLQAIAEALRLYQADSGQNDIHIWGYRNVWYRFGPAEANLFVPVSLSMFSTMHEAFDNAFMSQRSASFPSHEHDGPFSELAQKIQVQQYQKIKTCLGRQWFNDHSSPLIRATRGFVFLKEMTADEFYQSCRQLRRSVEDS